LQHGMLRTSSGHLRGRPGGRTDGGMGLEKDQGREDGVVTRAGLGGVLGLSGALDQP
jgi:hypothetical protein